MTDEGREFAKRGEEYWMGALFLHFPLHGSFRPYPGLAFQFPFYC